MVDFHFDEIIKIQRANFDGTIYSRVSCIEAESQDGNTLVQLVTPQLLVIHENDLYRMVISHTVDIDASDVTGYHREGRVRIDQLFETVMFGTVHNMSMDLSGPDPKGVVLMSFGGLQCMMKSEPAKLQKFTLGEKIYLFLNRV